MREEFNSQEQKTDSKPPVTDDWKPTGSPEIDWAYLKEQNKELFHVHTSSKPTPTPIPGLGEGAPKQVTEDPEPAQPSPGQPVPEADLKPQSEEDFVGEPLKEASNLPAPNLEEPEAELPAEWGEPQPSDWEEPTPPEWDGPQSEPSDELPSELTPDPAVHDPALQGQQGAPEGDQQHDNDPVSTPDDDGNGGEEEASEPVFSKDRRLVIIVPVNQPSPDLCKFMVSAIALGYPPPIIVNWGRDPYEMSKWEGGPNLSKISGIMRYLDAALHQDAHPDEWLHEDDVVVIADGFDVWFQLPPEVLIMRYHEINARANARLREQWTHEEPMPMQQTVVVSAQKRCWPSVEEGSNLHCDELPESPLREDLYGPETDKILGPKIFSNFRPRYINGGVYIGAAGALRRMFRRAYDKVDSETSKGVHLFSEQGISGEVLGEQETWRNWRREIQLASAGAVDLMERDFEYHIGLDYAQELSYPTCHSEKDGWIVPLNRRDLVDTHSFDRGITPVRVIGVPEDVRAASNPLQGLVEAPDWGNMPLYVDFFTETIPVLLHHNAWKDDLKQRRIWWWDQTWFFPHLRELLARHLTPAPLEPLATVNLDGRDVTYWASHSGNLKRKPRLLIDKAFEPLNEIEWDAVCRDPEENVSWEKHWWDEVFRDGKGPL